MLTGIQKFGRYFCVLSVALGSNGGCCANALESGMEKAEIAVIPSCLDPSGQTQVMMDQLVQIVAEEGHDLKHWVEQVCCNTIDVQAMVCGLVGTQVYQSASIEQQEAATIQFSRYLAHTLVEALESYDPAQPIVTKEKLAAATTSQRREIHLIFGKGPGALHLQLYWEQRPSHEAPNPLWKITDFGIENIRFLATKKLEWSKKLGSRDIQTFIRLIDEELAFLQDDA